MTFVDSTSTKRAIDQVNGTMFKDNKISISYAPTDNFLFLGNLALSIDESMLGVFISFNIYSTSSDISYVTGRNDYV